MTSVFLACTANKLLTNVRMPPKLSSSDRLRKAVRKYPSEFQHDGRNLFCKLCERIIAYDRADHVSQHRSSKEHSTRLSDTRQSARQSLLHPVEVSSGSDLDSNTAAHGPNKVERRQFYNDLCEYYVKNDIPFWKANSEATKQFFAKWTKISVPDESNLRKYYLPKAYNYQIESIRKAVSDRPIWVSVDETPDKLGRCISAVVIGTLSEKAASVPLLLHIDELANVNHSTTAQLVQSALAVLWPNGIRYEQVRLFVTDAAPYMKKAAKGLHVLFPNMIHITCAAHGLHNAADFIRLQFPRVNSLIASCKAVFVKAHTRCQRFKEILPNVPLPPEPVITRWGTWLEAACYYASHLRDIQRVFDELDESDAASIRTVKNLLRENELSEQLTFIYTYYSFIPKSIVILEKQGLPLIDAIEVIENAKRNFAAAPGEVAESIREKYESVLAKNTGLLTLRAIAKVLSCAPIEDAERSLLDTFQPSEIALYRYGPVCSCDVERIFSRFKSVLRSNRQRFTVEHVRWHMVSHCNS